MSKVFGYSTIVLLIALIGIFLINTISYKKVKSFSCPEEAYAKRPLDWAVTLVFFLTLVSIILFFHFDLGMPSEYAYGGGNPTEGWKNLGMMFDIDWEFFFGFGSYSFEDSVIWFLIKTFGIAYIGTAVASLLAIPFGLFASHKLFGKAAWPFEIILIAIRTFPEIVFALILVKLSGFSFVSGVLVIGIHSIGMIGKLYADQIDGIKTEPIEGVLACGASKWQQIHLAVMPQVKPNLVSVALYRFDINVRTATILGVVLGVDGGIGYYLSTEQYNYHHLGACILGIVILVIGINLISSLLRKKLV